MLEERKREMNHLNTEITSTSPLPNYSVSQSNRKQASDKNKKIVNSMQQQQQEKY
jgi:hypothetical protein